MICAIHQPNFIPYLGFFNKFKKSDVFVLYDHVQYAKNDFHNRNRLKINGKGNWLTIPVNVHFGQKINEVKFANRDFINKHLESIKQNYKKSEYFNEIFPDIERIYLDVESDNFSDFNIRLLKFLFNKFDKNKKVFLSSELGLDYTKRSTEALIDACQKVGADKYLSGSGAKNYINESLFLDNNIELIWQDFHHPIYKQLGNDFIENLSVLDALFNLGYQKTYEII